MTVAIVSAGSFVQTQNGIYVRPHDWKGYSQWVCLFHDIRLMLLRRSDKHPPDGWVQLPKGIEVRELCKDGDSYFERRRFANRNKGKCLEGVKMLLARMPSYEVYWVFREALRRKIPVLLELHGDWETSARVSETSGSLLRLITRRYRAGFARRAIAEVADQAFAVVTIGPALAEKYVHKKKPVLISTNHTLDEREYRQRQEYDIKKVPRFLFVGDLQERKGLRCLFFSLAQLKKMGREFRIDLVGTGPSKAYLESYAQQNGFGEWVNFVGYVPLGPKLLEYYRHADVFVLPSIAGEGVPRVTHEAMSQGCPVIATDIGSIKWQLEGGAGIVVPPVNVAALTESIIRVLGDKELRRRLSINGFNRSMEFTFEKQSEKIAAFVKKYVPHELLA